MTELLKYILIVFIVIVVVIDLVTAIMVRFKKASREILIKFYSKPCQLNPIDSSIIIQSVGLSRNYVSTTFSFLFPYYLSAYDSYYGIIRFSKAYYITKSKYKELKQVELNERIKKSEQLLSNRWE